MPCPPLSALPITKLRPPSPACHELVRTELVARLMGVQTRRIALVVGPTGSGKTTLLAEACRRLADNGLATAWLTLDRCERVPRYFLEHLTAAIGLALPQLESDVPAMLRGDTTPAEAVAATLINELTAAARPLVIFLDDFQEADSTETTALVAWLARYLPAEVHLVIGSQRELPISLAWAHARGWSIGISWDDLRLSAEEIRSYLLDIRGLPLAEAQVDDLAVQTEGWACALQLAATALEHAPGQLPRLSGTGFADALLDELFERQDAGLKRFLLDTSILEKLSPSLCAAVVDVGTCGFLLGDLEKTHFLVQRLDASSGWFRYHRLLASFLRKRLRADDPDRARLLHRRAGDWFAANRHVNEALNHWLAAGAVESAAALLCRHGTTLLRNAELTELDHWLGRLPASAVAASPVLSTLAAWCALHNGRPLALRRALDEARASAALSGTGASPALRSEWTILSALGGLMRYDWLDSDGVRSDLPQAFDETHPLQRGFAHVVVGYEERKSGELGAASGSFRAASELADADGLTSVACVARHALAAVELLRARPESALAALRAWFADDGRRAWWRSAGGAFLRTAEARALMDLGRLDEAAAALDEATGLLANSGASGFLGIALTLRARLHGIEGRPEAAFADLTRARAGALTHRISRVLFRADLCEAWLRLRNGEIAQAEQLLSQALEVLVESGQGFGENVESWQHGHCEWLLAAHRPQEAHVLALAAENQARQSGRTRSVIDFLLLRAIAAQSRPGGLAAGNAPFREAQQLAFAGNVRLPFRVHAAALAPLAAAIDPASARDGGNALPAVLHQREAQILRLLDQGLRNKDIAARLFLSEETVKWYLKRLYDNFDAGNRVQLLAKIRKLGLLAESAS